MPLFVQGIKAHLNGDLSVDKSTSAKWLWQAGLKFIATLILYTHPSHSTRPAISLYTSLLSSAALPRHLFHRGSRFLWHAG
jgi:hypothetical protein